jgi:hypothetical protein
VTYRHLLISSGSTDGPRGESTLTLSRARRRPHVVRLIPVLGRFCIWEGSEPGPASCQNRADVRLARRRSSPEHPRPALRAHPGELPPRTERLLRLVRRRSTGEAAAPHRATPHAGVGPQHLRDSYLTACREPGPDWSQRRGRDPAGGGVSLPAPRSCQGPFRAYRSHARRRRQRPNHPVVGGAAEVTPADGGCSPVSTYKGVATISRCCRRSGGKLHSTRACPLR